MEEQTLNVQKIRKVIQRILIANFAIFTLIFGYQFINGQAIKILSPLPSKISALDAIRPKLFARENTFKVNDDLSFVPKVNAAGISPDASSYLVMDYDTGKVISDKSGSKKLPIASLTKIMTSIVALDLASPEERITITQNASRAIPTKIGVVPGQQMTLNELLHAALMTSANDAVEAIKDGVNNKYGADIFVQAMNEKAKFLGLKNTHFANPQGFDSPENYSTARDLAVLTHYAHENYPLVAQIVKKDYIFLPEDQYHKQFDLYNWNGLIGVYPNVMGMKIGNTGDAGTTTVVISQREGKKILSVVLGAHDIWERDMWAAQLLDVGFESILNLPPIQVTKEMLREKYASWRT